MRRDGDGVQSKGLDQPFVRDVGGHDDCDISTDEATRCRAVIATANISRPTAPVSG